MILELISLENESKAVQYEGEVFEVYLQGDGGLHSADIVKNHCVNVLIKLNNPQCILYKTCLRNLFFEISN